MPGRKYVTSIKGNALSNRSDGLGGIFQFEPEGGLDSKKIGCDSFELPSLPDNIDGRVVIFMIQ